MKSITELIKSADFLGVKPELYVNKNTRYQSYFGGILSIMVMGMCIGCSIYFFFSYLNKYQIFTVVTTMPFTEYVPVPLGKESFELFIGIEDQSYKYYDAWNVVSISMMENKQKLINGTFYYFQQEIEVLRCSEQYQIGELNQKYGLNFPLDKFFCPNISRSVNFHNRWGMDGYSSLVIYINYCNETTNPNCLPKENITKLIQGGYISMYYGNIRISPNNVTTPLTYYIDNTYQLLNSKSSIDIAFHVTPVEFITDIGDFFEEIETLKSFQIPNPGIFYDISETEKIANIIFEYGIQGSRTNRFFTKLQDLLTRIGGTTNSFISGGYLINYIFSNSLLLLYYVNYTGNMKCIDKKKFKTPFNELSSLEKSQEKSNSKSLNLVENSKFFLKNENSNVSTVLKLNDRKNEIATISLRNDGSSYHSPKSNIEIVPMKDAISNHFIQKEKEKEIKDNSDKSRISFGDVLCQKCRNNKGKNEIIENIKEFFKISSNIEYISFKNFELEIIKFLLLTPQEIQLIRDVYYEYFYNNNFNPILNSYLKNQYYDVKNEITEVPFEQRKKLVFGNHH
jgi:hypothetical protein